MDDLAWRAGPLWDRRDVATESVVIHIMDEVAEGGSFFIWIGLELGMMKVWAETRPFCCPSHHACVRQAT